MCRKLAKCNTQQTSQLIIHLPQIFAKNNCNDLLIKILLTGLCTHHKNLSALLFENINSILPNEKQLNIMDTMTTAKINNNY